MAARITVALDNNRIANAQPFPTLFMPSTPICRPLWAVPRRGLRSLVAVLPVLVASAALAAGEGAPAPIGLDLSRLDEAGLYGPPDGLRALDYEFCIPDGDAFRVQVASIDSSARFFPGSRGRIGCTAGQILAIGSTHQPGFREVLGRLAALPFVERIEQAFFE
jgi:hypothetical protein